MATSILPRNQQSLEITTERKSIAISYSNQRYKDYELNVSKPGYKAIGVVGYEFSTIDWYLSRCYIANDILKIMTFRASASSSSGTFYADIMYIPI